MSRLRTVCLALSLLAVAPSASPQEILESQPPAFLRVLEGPATLIAENGETSEAQLHSPIAIGDALALEAASRAEILLADATRIRAAGPAELSLIEELGSSPKRFGLYLKHGDLQVRTPNDIDGDDRGEALRIASSAGDLYLAYPGRYRIQLDPTVGLSLIVRQGRIEVVTGQRSFLVREGELADISTDEWPRIQLAAAPGLDELERWALTLEQAAVQADVPWVEPELRYAAAPLSEHGSWIGVDGAAAWRPYAATSWQPYNDGYWSYAPGGMFWVSHEPWGWLPYHYGYWDLHHVHGWIWFPGRVYSGAHVTFHWGSSWVGWTPTHYYHRSRVHRRYGHGGLHRSGSGGHQWVYCPTTSLGLRYQNRFHRDREPYAGQAHRRSSPTAIVTDDTRGLTPDTWTDARRTRDVLLSRRVVPRTAIPRDTVSTVKSHADTTVRTRPWARQGLGRAARELPSSEPTVSRAASPRLGRPWRATREPVTDGRVVSRESPRRETLPVTPDSRRPVSRRAPTRSALPARQDVTSRRASPPRVTRRSVPFRVTRDTAHTPARTARRPAATRPSPSAGRRSTSSSSRSSRREPAEASRSSRPAPQRRSARPSRSVSRRD